MPKTSSKSDFITQIITHATQVFSTTLIQSTISYNPSTFLYFQHSYTTNLNILATPTTQIFNNYNSVLFLQHTRLLLLFSIKVSALENLAITLLLDQMHEIKTREKQQAPSIFTESALFSFPFLYSFLSLTQSLIRMLDALRLKIPKFGLHFARISTPMRSVPSPSRST